MKRILFIIPFIPYPLNSGGNQAFFNMVDYIRHKMSVSMILGINLGPIVLPEVDNFFY